MALLLPPIAFVLFYLILRWHRRDRLEAGLAAAIFCGTCVAAITELLSLPGWIGRIGISLSWLAICIAAFLYLRSLKHPQLEPDLRESAVTAGELDVSMKFLLGGAGVIAAVVATIALIAPPSLWDAMQYHLTRVSMWMSNHSVRFFETPDYAHLVFSPWAEYAMMHTHLLWGGDRFVNFVDFFSFIGCAAAASWIAGLLGASLTGQALAAIFSITIPQGILEASGPANTYVVAFWIATTVAFLIRWHDDPTWFNTICTGLAMDWPCSRKAPRTNIFLFCFSRAGGWGHAQLGSCF